MPLRTDRNAALILLLLVIVSVWGAYYPSLSVPFYLDDTESIISNQLLHASSIEPLFNSGYASRIVGYASFWANYQVNGLEPMGYHIVNIAIHVINGVLVFLLASYFLSRFNREQQVPDGSNQNLYFWAILIAGFWMLHPLNSQPVIYIVQRLTSIVTLFVLSTIIFYMKSRECKNLRQALPYIILTLVSAVAGVVSKQNFVIVFVFLYLFECFTANQVVRRNLIRVATIAFVTLAFVAPLPFLSDFWHFLDQFTRDEGAPERAFYFYTQMLVLWDYIFRFFLPIQLQLEINVPLITSLEVTVAVALLAHVGLIVTAVRLRKSIPLFFTGILLFYSSHCIESFIFPIKDLAFEHRTYLGNIGLSFALIGTIKYWYEKVSRYDSRGVWPYAVFSVLAVLSVIAITHRAKQWQDPIEFYEREVSLSPDHPRANASLGNELAKVGRFEEAEKYLKKSIDISLKRGTVTAGALNSYMNILYQQKKFQQAAPIVMIALQHIRYPGRRSVLLSNLAVGYIYMGYCDFALGLLEQALKLNPANSDATKNRAYCLNQLNRS